MNACFGCEKQLQESQALRGHYICPNQRCARFGVLTTVFLAPSPETEDPPSPTKPEDEAIKEDEVKEDGTDLPTD